MSIPIQKKVSQGKQVRSVIEKVEILEGDVQRLFEAVNQTSMNANQQTQQLAAINEAIVELLGAATVDAKMKEINERKILERLESAKEALAVGLAKGDLVKADAIGDQSLVVGREFDTKGEVSFPGRVQLQMSGIKPEFQEKLLGLGAGSSIETPGGKFEILEVYNVVVKEPQNNDPETMPADAVAQLEAQLQPQGEA